MTGDCRVQLIGIEHQRQVETSLPGIQFLFQGPDICNRQVGRGLILFWNGVVDEEIVQINANEVRQFVGQFKGHAFLFLIWLTGAIDDAPGE